MAEEPSVERIETVRLELDTDNWVEVMQGRQWLRLTVSFSCNSSVARVYDVRIDVYEDHLMETFSVHVKVTVYGAATKTVEVYEGYSLYDGDDMGRIETVWESAVKLANMILNTSPCPEEG